MRVSDHIAGVRSLDRPPKPVSSSNGHTLCTACAGAGIASAHFLLGEPMVVAEGCGCAVVMVGLTVNVLGTATRSSRSLLARVPVGKSGNDEVGKSTTTEALGAAMMQRDQAPIVDPNLGLRNLDMVKSAGRRVVFELSNVVQGAANWKSIANSQRIRWVGGFATSSARLTQSK